MSNYGKGAGKGGGGRGGKRSWRDKLNDKPTIEYTNEPVNMVVVASKTEPMGMGISERHGWPSVFFTISPDDVHRGTGAPCSASLLIMA